MTWLLRSYSLIYSNKKEDPVVAKINYTVSDLEAFGRIVESNASNTNNQTAAKNADAKNLMSNIDRSSIKIIDFDKLKKIRDARMILKRWGKPKDLVGPCIFLASDASKYITGQDIYVDGGWTANGGIL